MADAGFAMQFFRADLEGRLIAVARIMGDGAAFRLTRSQPSWARTPELDRLARQLPGDLIYWSAVDEATARSSVAELGGTWE